MRYIVRDVSKAAAFYVEILGFDTRTEGPGFAMLRRGDLTLLLNEPGAGGAGQPDASGRTPEPGGWNRFQLNVDDLDDRVARLRDSGFVLRTDVIEGRGGRQALMEDPSGNLIELFTTPPRDR